MTKETKKTNNEEAEAIVTAVSKTESFIRNNKGLLYGILIAIVVIAAIYVGYDKLVSSPKKAEAMQQMFPAEEIFRSGDYEKALNGDGKGYLGYVKIADQYGSPTYTADLAPLLVEMIKTDKYGVYHATNEGVCTWAEFAEEIFKIAGMNVKVNHITTAEYLTRAKRPMNSRLNKMKLEFNSFRLLKNWKEVIKEFFIN